jgi:hypothetical protein
MTIVDRGCGELKNFQRGRRKEAIPQAEGMTGDILARGMQEPAMLGADSSERSTKSSHDRALANVLAGSYEELTDEEWSSA